MFSFITFILEDEYRLSLGMLMHVKCIHELCIVLLIFHPYLHHIRVISIFYNVLGNISHFPYLFGINPALSENPFFYILMFQGPKRRPNDLIFHGDHFLEGTRLRSEGRAKVEGRGPKGVGPRGQIPWPRGAPHLGPRASDAIDVRLPGSVLT